MQARGLSVQKRTRNAINCDLDFVRVVISVVGVMEEGPFGGIILCRWIDSQNVMFLKLTSYFVFQSITRQTLWCAPCQEHTKSLRKTNLSQRSTQTQRALEHILECRRPHLATHSQETRSTHKRSSFILTKETSGQRTSAPVPPRDRTKTRLMLTRATLPKGK